MKRVLVGALLLLFAGGAIAPIAYMFLASLASGTALQVSLSGASLDAYATVLTSPDIMSSIWLTAAIAALSAACTVLLATPAAYAFARMRSRINSVLASSLLLAWLLPQVFIAIAFFTFAARVRLYGNPWFMVFFGVLHSVPLSVWVLRNFIETIPKDIDEAAVMDGASLSRFLTKILLPIAAPSVAAVAGYSFLITWQLYLYPLVYLAGSKYKMVSTGVANFIGEWSTNYPQMMAYSTLITLPLIAVFLVVQKYIIAGLSSGAVNA